MLHYSIHIHMHAQSHEDLSNSTLTGEDEIMWGYELGLCSQYCSPVRLPAVFCSIWSCYELLANLVKTGI